MKSGFEFQPKPEKNHYVTIHKAYKDITDGTASAAAVLSVLEYLAESTFVSSGGVSTSLPDSVVISGNCNTPLLKHLLDDLIGETAIKNKLKLLEELGYITITITNGRHRIIGYHRKSISDALAGWTKGSLSDPSKSDPSESDDSIPLDPSKSDPLTRQKVTPTNHITNLSFTNQENVREKGHKYEQGLTPYQGSDEFMNERPWILKWRRANPVYMSAYLDFVAQRLKKTDRYKDGISQGDVIGYVGRVNTASPETTDIERLQRLNGWWNEWEVERDVLANAQPTQAPAAGSLPWEVAS